MATIAPGQVGPLPSREEIARAELGHTDVSPVTARVFVAWFLLLIAVMPVAEFLAGRTGAAGEGDGAWSHLRALPRDVRSAFTPSAAAGPDQGAGRLWPRVVAANRAVLAGLSAFESALEDESALGRALRPPAQVVMTGRLGAGNERVYPGRDGWLFYRADVDSVTGRPFLAPRQISRRIAAADEWTSPPAPDPRPAIVQLHRDLAARGIALVVMPTPVKPSVHPEWLARRLSDEPGVVRNPSFDALVEDLRREGVLVFDPADDLAAATRSPEARYLATDTHWRPEAMERVAQHLAAFVAAEAPLPAVPDPGYAIERAEARNTGDITRMLDLPAGSTLFPDEAVWLRRVLQADGSLWRSSRDADVLLLGDSFANIYSLESLGWGTSAGLAEQLSDALGRPLDRFVQNDAGAFATREMLAREPGRLDGKRLVIYQFAERELAFGDWKILPLIR
jgi:alginate O-acetyltransferase complex protein AlgJ